MLAAERSRSIWSEVKPWRSRAIRMALCSSVESPGFLAFPLRLRGARPTMRREPLADFRMKVSSASTMPATAPAFLDLAEARKRWRQRNEVSRWMSFGAAAFRRLTPSTSERA
jgi:hypothetical protein